MTEPAKSGNVQNGLIFGLIIGFIYCISLFLRYNVASSIIMFGVIALLFYLLVIGMLFFCGIKRRTELGGFIELKNAFQTIFIAILIAELIYTIFNVIYLKFIDPNFFERWQANMETFLEKTIKDDDKREDALNKFKESMEKQKLKGLTFQGMALGYLISVAITGVFGFIAALIIRKRKTAFELDNQ
jgi:nitrate reductase NapE component